MLRIVCALSMPVVPKTPVRTTETDENAAKSCGSEDFKCRVTIIPSAVSGPTASGVTARLPRQAIRKLCARSTASKLLSRSRSAAAQSGKL